MTNDNNEPPKGDNKEITQDNFTLEKKSKNKDGVNKKSPNFALRVLLLLILFLCGSAAGVYFLPTLKERIPIIATWVGEDNNQNFAAINQTIDIQTKALTALEQKSNEQERRLNQLILSSNTESLQGFSDRLSALEKNMFIDTPLEDAPTDTSQSARIDMLLSRMSQLEAAFIPLSKNMLDGAAAEREREQLKRQSGTLSEQMTSFKSRLEGLETHAARDNSGLLLNMKISELKKKVVSGATYNEELNAVKRLVENGALQSHMALSSALSYLETHSQNGLPTPRQLKARFNDLIPRMITTTSHSIDQAWWQSTLDQLQNMVSVRNTSSESTGLDGMIAKMESWLESDEMNSALNILNELPDALQQLLSTWKADLEFWLKGEEAIKTIEAIATENYLIATDDISTEAST